MGTVIILLSTCLELLHRPSTRQRNELLIICLAQMSSAEMFFRALDVLWWLFLETFWTSRIPFFFLTVFSWLLGFYFPQDKSWPDFTTLAVRQCCGGSEAALTLGSRLQQVISDFPANISVNLWGAWRLQEIPIVLVKTPDNQLCIILLCLMSENLSGRRDCESSKAHVVLDDFTGFIPQEFLLYQ